MTGITVTGTGEATGAPDIVDLDLGIAVLDDTVQSAAATATEKATALISSLTDRGIERDSITTTEYSIHPEYDYSSNQQRLVGYRVNNTVRVRIRDLGATGSLVDAAAAAAGDDFRVNGIRFAVEDETSLARAARTAAWEDAMAKARQLADLAGLHLGTATAINESVDSPPVPVFRQRVIAAESAQTPIEPGAAMVAVTIQVNFALEG